MKSVLKFLIVFFPSLILITCSDGDGYNSKISFTVVPDEPFVYPNDKSLTDDVTITAPYFLSRLKANNTATDRYLVIVGVRFEILDSSGNVLGQASLNTTGLTNQDYLLIVPPETETAMDETFYIENLPIPKELTNVSYSVRAFPLGWFSDLTKCDSCGTDALKEDYLLSNPDDRLNRQFYFRIR